MPGEGGGQEREWEDMVHNKERIFPTHASLVNKTKAEDRT